MRVRRLLLPALLLTAVLFTIAGSASPPGIPWSDLHGFVLAPAPAEDWQPMAAARCDRDRDGDADLVVAYAGREVGAVVWFPVHGSVIGDCEPPQLLEFPPSSLVAGDFDADGFD